MSFSVQDEIVREIVSTINLMHKAQAMKIPPGRVHPTNNLEAFDYWLQAVEAGTDLTKQGHMHQRDLLEKAIALDPAYADPYALLATNYMTAAIAQYDQDPKKDAARAVAMAQHAIALDDSNWLAYMCGMPLEERQRFRVFPHPVVALKSVCVRYSTALRKAGLK